MTMTTRRKMLAALAGAALAPVVRADDDLPADARTLLDNLDPLLAQARAWLAALLDGGESLVPKPVAHLQRRYRLGHRRASNLAAALVRSGAWTLFTDHAGRRYARVHARVPR